jgi:hypothetical protein
MRAALELARQFNEPALIVRVAAAAQPLEDAVFLEAGNAAASRILADLQPSPLRAAFEASQAMDALRGAH